MRWVPFRFGESCAETLLGLSDTRLTRLGELYRIWWVSRGQKLTQDVGHDNARTPDDGSPPATTT